MALKKGTAGSVTGVVEEAGLASNAPYFDAEKMAMKNADETLLPKIERVVSNDFSMMSNYWKRMRQPGAKFGEQTKQLWEGLVANSNGSKIMAGSRLGAYAAGVAMVADLLNPLSPGWGD